MPFSRCFPLLQAWGPQLHAGCLCVVPSLSPSFPCTPRTPLSAGSTFPPSSPQLGRERPGYQGMVSCIASEPQEVSPAPRGRVRWGFGQRALVSTQLHPRPALPCTLGQPRGQDTAGQLCLLGVPAGVGPAAPQPQMRQGSRSRAAWSEGSLPVRCCASPGSPVCLFAWDGKNQQGWLGGISEEPAAQRSVFTQGLQGLGARSSRARHSRSTRGQPQGRVGADSLHGGCGSTCPPRGPVGLAVYFTQRKSKARRGV